MKPKSCGFVIPTMYNIYVLEIESHEYHTISSNEFQQSYMYALWVLAKKIHFFCETPAEFKI